MSNTRAPGEPAAVHYKKLTPAAEALRLRQNKAIAEGRIPMHTTVGNERVVPGFYMLRGERPRPWVDSQRAAQSDMRAAAVEALLAKRRAER